MLFKPGEYDPEELAGFGIVVATDDAQEVKTRDCSFLETDDFDQSWLIKGLQKGKTPKYKSIDEVPRSLIHGQEKGFLPEFVNEPGKVPSDIIEISAAKKQYYSRLEIALEGHALRLGISAYNNGRKNSRVLGNEGYKKTEAKVIQSYRRTAKQFPYYSIWSTPQYSKERAKELSRRAIKLSKDFKTSPAVTAAYKAMIPLYDGQITRSPHGDVMMPESVNAADIIKTMVDTVHQLGSVDHTAFRELIMYRIYDLVTIHDNRFDGDAEKRADFLFNDFLINLIDKEVLIPTVATISNSYITKNVSYAVNHKYLAKREIKEQQSKTLLNNLYTQPA